MLNFRPFKDYFENIMKKSQRDPSFDLKRSNDPDLVFKLNDSGYDYIDYSRISELDTGVLDEYNDQYLEYFRG